MATSTATIQSLFVATLVHPPSLGSLQILPSQLLAVSAHGFITHIAPLSDLTSQSLLSQNPLIKPTQLPPSSFLIPTFVDLHLHAPQFLYLGTGLHLPLLEWLDAYAYKAEERLDADPVLARRVYVRLAERLLEAGTGAVLAFGTIKEETNLILADVMQTKGLRAHVGKLSMDISSRPSYVESPTSASLSSAQSFISRCRSSIASLPEHLRLVQPVITPRFVPTCSDDLLKGLGKLARDEDVFVQSHLAEARDQVDWVRETRQAEDIDVFDRSGLLTSKTVQAHCTFLSPSNLTHLHTIGTSIAHCPLSNAYFSSQILPLREALNMGVKLGLGTDVAGGYQIGIMDAMRSAVATSRIRDGVRSERAREEGKQVEGSVKVDWKEALYLATKGGAQVLGLQTGEFVVGAPFDAQRINLVNPSG
ncbi:hypothetical protein FRB99_002439, partial [Tulasnella sp. 403]